MSAKEKSAEEKPSAKRGENGGSIVERGGGGGMWGGYVSKESGYIDHWILEYFWEHFLIVNTMSHVSHTHTVT